MTYIHQHYLNRVENINEVYSCECKKITNKKSLCESNIKGISYISEV